MPHLLISLPVPLAFKFFIFYYLIFLFSAFCLTDSLPVIAVRHIEGQGFTHHTKRPSCSCLLTQWLVAIVPWQSSTWVWQCQVGSRLSNSSPGYRIGVTRQPVGRYVGEVFIVWRRVCGMTEMLAAEGDGRVVLVGWWRNGMMMILMLMW